MVSSDHMAKFNGRSKAAAFFSDGILYSGVGLVAFLVVCAVWSLLSPAPPPPGFAATPFSDVESNLQKKGSAAGSGGGGEAAPTPSVTCNSDSGPDRLHDPPDRNFYDDPGLSYTIDSPAIKNWDEKRRQWLEQHPSFLAGAENRILMVTGSQATPCKNPIGDYLLLKLFKNKVDYCRRHGIDIFYNNVLLHPKMFSFWAKTPAVKAAMLAHPEAEWIWWVDSDAAITDMDFKLPLDRYKNHNMVVHGWLELIFKKKSWTSINAGVFLLRNCQWSVDLIDRWAQMGPQSPEYDEWGKILSSTFRDKIFPESDDQSGLAYLILKENEKWGAKIYVEGEYYFEGYWMDIVGTLDNITDRYTAVEMGTAALRRRHAEKVSEGYAREWEDHLKEAGHGRGSWRRPFITHFTGCQPCSGAHNEIYSGRSCVDAMQRALLFADNQVLRSYGFVHPDTIDPAVVRPLPFNHPATQN
ncbi:putative glycosyltransferase 7 [Andrographis paniculata]|uniref:putative glycosyltransferase 7 n=1 Tax=Andrographis paniculata TaxID=175694 RepID=UPI0021E875DD|nr:putative glycosyltransferase 7 [Andrographis paniculata]